MNLSVCVSRVTFEKICWGGFFLCLINKMGVAERETKSLFQKKKSKQKKMATSPPIPPTKNSIQFFVLKKRFSVFLLLFFFGVSFSCM